MPDVDPHSLTDPFELLAVLKLHHDRPRFVMAHYNQFVWVAARQPLAVQDALLRRARWIFKVRISTMRADIRALTHGAA